MATSGVLPMKEETVTDALLREFLLGKVNDEDRERIESLFLTDSQTRERVLVAEQDLIEDFLEDSLTTADRERFVSLYAQTAEQRRKLRITKSIKDWAISEPALPQTIPANVSGWSRLRSWLRLNPVFVIPVAVTAMIAIVVAAVWLNNRAELRNRRLAIEQELAQLNAPSSLRGVPPQMVSFDLSPVAVRGIEQQKEITTRDDVRIVELRLPWIQKERHSTYQAEVRRVDDDESFTIRNLQAETDGRNVIRIRLPAHILRRGHYQIRLRGIADGSASYPEEYSFAVGG
jgi:hypothetical protein